VAILRRYRARAGRGPRAAGSCKLGSEGLGDATAGADAGRYGGEGRDDEHAPQHHGEQRPERRDGHGIVVEGVGQR
jgi:hypothetical protein